MVRCTLHLYFPPGWELGEEASPEPLTVRELGERVRADCAAAADALAALRARGWTCRTGRYELIVEKACDRATAMRDFLRAGLDPVALDLRDAGEPGRPVG
jgi:hypothetical protein